MTLAARSTSSLFAARSATASALVFEGMRLERSAARRSSPAAVRDQAHLHGLLERIQELGLELVSVNPAAEPRRTRMGIVTTTRRHGDLLQGLGQRAAGRAQPRLAAEARTAGRPRCSSWPRTASAAIAHDRRGHGRSTQTVGRQRDGHLRRRPRRADRRRSTCATSTLVGFSTGGGEVARYIGRHGTGRVAQASCSSPPCRRSCCSTDDNPAACRSRCSTGSAPARSPTARSSTRISPTARSSATTGRARTSSQGIRDAFWRQGMQSGHRNALECIAAFSATDFRADLADDRRADAGHPRRRRPGRAVRRRRPGVGRADRRRASSRSTPAPRTASPTPTRSSSAPTCSPSSTPLPKGPPMSADSIRRPTPSS